MENKEVICIAKYKEKKKRKKRKNRFYLTVILICLLWVGYDSFILFTYPYTAHTNIYNLTHYRFY